MVEETFFAKFFTNVVCEQPFEECKNYLCERSLTIRIELEAVSQTLDKLWESLIVTQQMFNRSIVDLSNNYIPTLYQEHLVEKLVLKF